MKKISFILLVTSFSISCGFAQDTWITFGATSDAADAIGNLQKSEIKKEEIKSAAPTSKEIKVERKHALEIAKMESKRVEAEKRSIANGMMRATNDSSGLTLCWGVLENTKHPILYIIEKNNDGANFTYFHSLQGDQSDSTVIYKFTTSKPEAGTSFYRLKKVFSDGHIEYSNVVMIYTSYSEKHELADEIKQLFVVRL